MKQVDFYLVQNQINQGRFKLVCRLAKKLQSLDLKSLIIVDTQSELHQLDKLLWTFSDTSFVAHESVPDTANPKSTAHLCLVEKADSSVLSRQYDVLINFAKAVPLFCHHFGRIAELVDATEESKAMGREKYKHYSLEGFQLETHQIEL